MLRTFRRRPLLVLILVLGLGVGPTASAFCAQLMDGHAMHGMAESHELAMGHGMDMNASKEGPPCHDGPTSAEAPPADVPPMEKGADCEAPCCTAVPEPIPLTVSPSVPGLVPVGSVGTDAMWTVEPVRVAIGEAERPPLIRLYRETQRVRI